MRKNRTIARSHKNGGARGGRKNLSGAALVLVQLTHAAAEALVEREQRQRQRLRLLARCSSGSSQSRHARRLYRVEAEAGRGARARERKGAAFEQLRRKSLACFTERTLCRRAEADGCCTCARVCACASAGGGGCCRRSGQYCAPESENCIGCIERRGPVALDGFCAGNTPGAGNDCCAFGWNR